MEGCVCPSVTFKGTIKEHCGFLGECHFGEPFMVGLPYSQACLARQVQNHRTGPRGRCWLRGGSAPRSGLTQAPVKGTLMVSSFRQVCSWEREQTQMSVFLCKMSLFFFPHRTVILNKEKKVTVILCPTCSHTSVDFLCCHSVV